MADLTGQDIIDKFKRLVQDEDITDGLALDLANTAKDEIEGDREWRMLLVVDTTNIFTTANDYTTEFTLFSDFSLPHKVKLIDSNNNEDEIEFKFIEERISHKNISNYACIDLADSKFYITGTVAENKTIHFWYFKATDDITLNTSPVWPSKFHKIILYRMAEIHLEGVDADTLTRLQWPAHKKVADRLYAVMVRWNSKFAIKAMNERAGLAE